MREQLFKLTYLRLLSTFVFLSSCISLFGQFNIKVLSGEKEHPLIGVEVFTENFNFAGITNQQGVIVIPQDARSEKLTFRYLGFEEQVVDLKLIGNDSITIYLQAKNEILEEIVLVGRSDIRSRNFLQKIDAIQSKEIATTNPQTSVDALARYADVYVQKSQMGGGSPVIRGFEANKVLLVVDGVRMNNAIYRNGHLQNAITIDNAILEQMEVIYGPSSLMYGSDALGGVVHFRTKDPMLNFSDKKKANVFGNYYARYGSANQEKSLHADINVGLNKWGSLTSLTLSDFDDLRMGSRRTDQYPDYNKRFTYQDRINNEDIIIENENENLQVGTGYSQLDLLQKLRYQINDHMNLTANLQYSTSSNIPRYDQLVLPFDGGLEFAEWNYGPQKRGLASLKYKWTEDLKWMDEMIIIASSQAIEESRIERAFGSDTRRTGIETVGVNALTIDMQKNFYRERKHTIYYGADVNFNTVESVAFETSITTDQRNDFVFTRYPSGGSSMSILGAYGQYINQSQDSTFVFHAGLRFSSYATTVRYLRSDPIQWPAFFYDDIDARNASVSWSAGVNWQPNPEWTVRLLAATAFRAPNVDDIGKLRINNDNVLVPNTALGAEQSTNGEININRKFGGSGLISGSFFYTRLQDAIVRQDFVLPDGSTSFQDGSRTYNVEGNINAEKAEIYGMSVNLRFQIIQDLNFSTSVNYIQGQVLGENEGPLAHIPPLYGRSQMNYLRGNWSFTFLSQYNGRKPIEKYGGSADNIEYATPEGALGWAIYNLYVDYNLNQYIFQIGIENILDKHYTPFASGVSGAGTNVILAVRGKF